jgi:pimeloyl-ACP methyl ester carboxylesterase
MQVRRKEHWFTYAECSVAVTEFIPDARPKGTIFFLHGRLGGGWTWDPLIQSLSGQFHCLQIDFPGFGRSFALEDETPSILENAGLLLRVLERFGGSPVILTGHDVGGALAQVAACHDPDGVDSMVLINSACLMSPLRELPLRPWGIPLKRAVRRMVEDSRGLSPEHRRELLRHAPVPVFEAIARSWPGPLERQYWRDRLMGLAQPVLMLWGSRDELNPPEAAAEMIREFPESYFHQHDELGHWPILEEPAWVSRHIRAFYAEILEPRLVTPARKFLSR